MPWWWYKIWFCPLEESSGSIIMHGLTDNRPRIRALERMPFLGTSQDPLSPLLIGVSLGTWGGLRG